MAKKTLTQVIVFTTMAIVGITVGYIISKPKANQIGEIADKLASTITGSN